jgi:uncharacterized protein (TIGR02246 family)
LISVQNWCIFEIENDINLSQNPNSVSMKKFIFLGLTFFALTAFVQQTDKKQVDFKAEEQAVRSISMKWLELVRSHDAAGVAALYTEDGVAFRPNLEPAVGRVALQKLEIQNLERNPKQIESWITDRVVIAVSGDLAIEYGSWSVTGAGLSGTEEDRGKYVTVYRKVNGTWKVASDISVSTKPEKSS